MDYDQTTIAGIYHQARTLNPATSDMWMDLVSEYASIGQADLIVDVGSGTGRFTVPLHDRFECQVIGVEPSETMREQAVVRKPAEARIQYHRGHAAEIPVDDDTATAAFMSMVYHHVPDPDAGFAEMHRVLCSGGSIFIRNNTIETLNLMPYLVCFPAAIEKSHEMVPRKDDIISAAERAGLSLVDWTIVEQPCAASPAAYYEKISTRPYSDLQLITDEEFEAGLRGLSDLVQEMDPDEPVIEGIDFLVFRKE